MKPTLKNTLIIDNTPESYIYLCLAAKHRDLNVSNIFKIEQSISPEHDALLNKWLSSQGYPEINQVNLEDLKKLGWFTKEIYLISASSNLLEKNKPPFEVKNNKYFFYTKDKRQRFKMEDNILNILLKQSGAPQEVLDFIKFIKNNGPAQFQKLKIGA